MANNLVYVALTFFTQNDTYNHIPNFGTPYAEYPVYTRYKLIILYANNCWSLPVKSLWSHTKDTQRLILMLLARDTVRSAFIMWIPLEHHIVV